MFGLDFNLFNNNYYIYERLLVLLFSLIPSLILIFFVLYSDRKSKEPVKNIVLCLLSGFLTISLSLFFELKANTIFSNSVVLTYVNAFIEEFCKLSIFLLFIFDNRYYDDLYDGIVYMALIGLSFAGLENIMYAFSENTVTDSITLALLRDFTTIPLHVSCAIVIGYFMSLCSFSKKKDKKIINFILAILLSLLIHGTYNNLMSFFSYINTENGAIGLLFVVIPLLLIMVGIILLAIKLVKKSRNLNKCFMKENIYDMKHQYLMNYDEYVCSTQKEKREKLSKYNIFERGDNNAS